MSATAVVQSEERIHVCCVFLCRDSRGRLLLHRRTDACRDEAGSWDCGGGALEFGEDPNDAVRREVHEEYGASAKHIRTLGTRNVLRGQQDRLTHWVALVFEVRVDADEVRVGEPEKMAELAWFDLETLPEPRHSQLDDHLALLTRAVPRPSVRGWLAEGPRLVLRVLPRGPSLPFRHHDHDALLCD